jgi:hypothetical protein
VGNQAERSSILINSQHPLMPLFITVTPGTTVTNSTVLDPTALNLLGNPAIDINGTVDGGSLSLAAGSVTTTALADDAVTFAKFQNIGTDRLLGRDTNEPGNVEELTVGGGLGFTGAGGIEIANNQVTYSKIEQVSGSRLLGNPTGSSANVSEITLGAGLAFQSGALVNTGAAKYRADFCVLDSVGASYSGANSIWASLNNNPFPSSSDYSVFRTQFNPTNFQLGFWCINCTGNLSGQVGFKLQYKPDAGAWTDATGGVIDANGTTSAFIYQSASLSISPTPTQILWRLLWVNTTGDNAVLALRAFTLSLWN